MEFKKGDKVVVIAIWNNHTAYFCHGIVASCGKKQMRVVDEKYPDQTLVATKHSYLNRTNTVDRCHVLKPTDHFRTKALKLITDYKQYKLAHYKGLFEDSTTGVYEQRMKRKHDDLLKTNVTVKNLHELHNGLLKTKPKAKKQRFIATFKDGTKVEYKGNRDVSIAWRVTDKNGGVLKTQFSKSRNAAEKTIRTDFGQRIHPSHTYSGRGSHNMVYTRKCAEKRGFKTVQAWQQHAQRENNEYFNSLTIEFAYAVPA